MKELMCTHLAKRGNRYYFRRKIPLDLLPHYYGRKEIMRSLGTSDRKEAERLARIAGVNLDEEFEKHRASQLIQTAIQPQTEREAKASSLLAANVAEKYKGSPTPTAYFTKFELRDKRDAAAASGTLKDFMARCRKEYAFHEAVLSGDESAVWDLRAHEGVRNGLRAVLTGEGNSGITAGYIERHLAAISAGGVQTPVQPVPNNAATLGTLLDKWSKERKPHSKTVDMTNRTVQRFYNYVGDMPIHTITRAHVVQFKDKLLASGQSPVNTNKQLVVINTLLNFARDNALISSNPASGVTVKVGNREKPRRSFDTAALNAIFTSPVYTDGERPKAGSGEAAYWLPLLALFTGARLEELGQLHPSDVMQEMYVNECGAECEAWVICIKNSKEKGQAVKNRGSVRRVPIHSELERLGFIAYAKAAQGRNRIFHELIPDKFGTETAQFSKWFGRYLRGTCKVENKRMTFHSFRHSFKDLCRLAEIGTEVHHALTGHTSGNVGDKYGADTYPLRSLVNAIERYKVPGVKLPSLQLEAAHTVSI